MSWRTRNKSYQQATLEGELLEMAKQADIINPETFVKASIEEKLTTIMSSLNKLHTKINTLDVDINKEDGISTKLDDVIDSVEKVLEESELKKFEVSVLKGTTHRQQQQVATLSDKVKELTVRSMADNITITGLIKESDDEDCLQVVSDFLKEKVKIEVETTQILIAHRIYVTDQEKTTAPIMIVRCHPRLKANILANAKNLKDLKNDKGDAFYINQQVPEFIIAEKKELSHTIRKIKTANEGKPPNQKVKYSVKRKKLFINDVPVVKAVQPPTVAELFTDGGEQEKIEKIKLHFSEPKEEKGSVFTAISVKVSNVAEIRRAYRKVRQTHPAADHIPMAYDCQKKQNCCDDGEFAAGLCIQKLLESQHAVNRAIFVVRNYGGRRLGPRRFSIIEEVAKQALLKVK